MKPYSAISFFVALHTSHVIQIHNAFITDLELYAVTITTDGFIHNMSHTFIIKWELYVVSYCK